MHCVARILSGADLAFGKSIPVSFKMVPHVNMEHLEHLLRPIVACYLPFRGTIELSSQKI